MDMLSYFLGRLAGGGTGGSGGDNGPVYTDLVYNDDGSITLTDDEGQEHIMECEYVDGRLEKVKIDGDILDAIYEEETDKLIKLGDINIEVGSYPSEIGNIEILIDNSGVLDSTEGSVSEKVEQLIDETAIYKDVMHYISFDYPTNLTDRFRQYKGTKLPKIDFANKTNVTRCFYSCINVENIDWYINTDICTVALGFLASMVRLKSMVGVNTASMTNVSNLFLDNFLLETIQEPLNFQGVINNNKAFDKCYKLKDIKFVKETIKLSLSLAWSPLLSAESTQSIIDGLATVETAQTLTLHKNIVLTDEQKATINAKGWTLAQ